MTAGDAIGFVGAGRVAHGLAGALAAAGHAVRAVASRNPDSAEGLAVRLPDCTALDAQGVADACDVVFLTVPDDTIAPACAAIRWRAGQAVVHCSGATEVAALDAAARAGAMTGGFHPLQSFAGTDTPLTGCTVTVEAAPPLEGTLAAMAATLGCRVNRLPPGARALYHASAGYGSQFLNVLMAEVTRTWESWGASEGDAVAAVLPMMRRTLDAMEAGGVAATMPGPVSRGDAGTVARHLDAYADDPVGLAFYRAHCLRTVDLAEDAGRIDGGRAADLRALLKPPPSPDAG